MHKQRILIVTRKWPPATGGMERYSHDLAMALTKSYETDVIRPHAKGKAKVMGAKSSMMFLVYAVVETWRRVPKADVVHIGDIVIWPVSWIARLRARQVRIVCVLYGLDLVYGNRQGFLPRLYLLYVRLARRWNAIDVFVAISRNTARLAEDAGFRPVVVVRPGVRTDISVSKPEEKAGAGSPMILFVGRMVERKGVGWFVREVLPELAASVRVVIAGPATDENEVQRLQRGGNVEYRGRVSQDELECLWREADLQIMPNRPSESRGDAEGFGLVAAEAAVRGVPVVAASVEGIPDAVIDGATGFLVEPDDVAGWREKIERILDWNGEERQAFAESCRARAVEEFNWDRVAREMVAVYTAGSNGDEGTARQ